MALSLVELGSRHFSITEESKKCKGCKRYWDTNNQEWLFKQIENEALSSVWYMGIAKKSTPSECQVCTELDKIKPTENKQVEGTNRTVPIPDSNAGVMDGDNKEYKVARHESLRSSNDYNKQTANDSPNNQKFPFIEESKQRYYETSDEEHCSNDLKKDLTGECDTVCCWNICKDIGQCQKSDDLVEGKSNDKNKRFPICSKVVKGYEDCGSRRYNPIWTGDDPNQIGVFIRNLKIEGVNEEKMTVDLHFYLNIVWLDEELCKYARKKYEKEGKWFKNFTVEEYKDLWKEARAEGENMKHEGVHPHLNKRPLMRIWSTTSDGFDERQNVISLNKEWIGKNTVYWRRLIRAKIYHCFECRTYPFGYEQVKLKVRLISYTKQHLVLLRTKLWYDAQILQTDKDLAKHSFSFLHPDNSLLTDWTLCSVHEGRDSWYSKFDHNDLSYRLPVYVSDGLDTQSWLEALIILKRRPSFVLSNIWLWFTLTPAVSLLTYIIDPLEDIAERLGIAVGIIFVQMQLKIYAASKTPRMPFTTALDVQMWISVLLVVIQAIAQVGVASSMKEVDDAKEIDTSIDRQIFNYNIGIVIVVNIATISIAKLCQTLQRLRIEEIVRCKATFKEGELCASPPAVKIEGYYKVRALRVTDRRLKNEYEQVDRENTHVGWFKYCKCLLCTNRA